MNGFGILVGLVVLGLFIEHGLACIANAVDHGLVCIANAIIRTHRERR